MHIQITLDSSVGLVSGLFQTFNVKKLVNIVKTLANRESSRALEVLVKGLSKLSAMSSLAVSIAYLVAFEVGVFLHDLKESLDDALMFVDLFSAALRVVVLG